MSMKKAVIQNNTVTNIVECSDEGMKGLRFPVGTTIWDCGQYIVAIGDKFHDGVFTREGEPLEAQPTEQNQIDQLRYEMDILMGVSE